MKLIELEMLAGNSEARRLMATVQADMLDLEDSERDLAIQVGEAAFAVLYHYARDPDIRSLARRRRLAYRAAVKEAHLQGAVGTFLMFQLFIPLFSHFLRKFLFNLSDEYLE